MLKYIVLENKETYETMERVIYAYSDEQVKKQCKLFLDDYELITIQSYNLNDFVADDNTIIVNRMNKMGLIIEGVADFKDIYDDWHNAIELITKLSLTLEECWKVFGVEERATRYANIEQLYNRIMKAMLSE